VGFTTGFALLVMWSQHVYRDRPSTGFTLAIVFIAAGFIVGPTLFGILATRFGGNVALLVTATPALLVALIPPAPENRLKPRSDEGARVDDRSLTLEDLVEEDDRVAVRARSQGTQLGRWRDLPASTSVARVPRRQTAHPPGNARAPRRSARGARRRRGASRRRWPGRRPAVLHR
jgi:MFS family permease